MMAQSKKSMGFAPLGSQIEGAFGVLVTTLLFNHRPLAELIRYRNAPAYWSLFAVITLSAVAAVVFLLRVAPSGFPFAVVAVLAAAEAGLYATPFMLLRDFFYKHDNAEREKLVHATMLLWLFSAALSAAFAALTFRLLAGTGLPPLPVSDQLETLAVWLPFAALSLWVGLARYVVTMRLVGFGGASMLATGAALGGMAVILVLFPY